MPPNLWHVPPNLWHVPPNLWHVPPNLWHVPQLSALSMRSQEKTPPGLDPENALQGVLKGTVDARPGALSMRGQENPPPGLDPENALQGVLKGLREQLTTVNEHVRDIQKTMKDEHKNMLLQMTTLRESMSKHADETLKQHRVQAEKTQEMQTQIAHSCMNPDLGARLQNLCGDFEKHSQDTHKNISEIQAHLDKMEAALQEPNAPYFSDDLEEPRMIPVAETVHPTPATRWLHQNFLPQAMQKGHAQGKQNRSEVPHTEI